MGTTFNTDRLVACLDTWQKALRRPTVVVLDRNSTHTAQRLVEQVARWQAQGSHLRLYWLPPRCPHLNPIERLWRHMRYYWLPLDATSSKERLAEALCRVLTNVGGHYQINFA